MKSITLIPDKVGCMISFSDGNLQYIEAGKLTICNSIKKFLNSTNDQYTIYVEFPQYGYAYIESLKGLGIHAEMCSHKKII